MKLSAVIFDLNGTILDDEDEYGKAFAEVLKSLGVEVAPDFPHTRGIGVKANWPIFQAKYKFKTSKTFEQLALETQEAYLKQISNISVRPGFDELLETLKENGIHVALATSNTWEVADKILDIIGITGEFEVITTSEEVLHNKPDPDIFTVTADKVGVDREDCLVIEDSGAGITAARRAGMKVIAISDGEITPEIEKADKVVEGFSEIKLREIELL
jgi:beta-phosphoglucomutase